MSDLELRDMACAMEIAKRFNPRKAPWIAMKIGEHMAEERAASAKALHAAEKVYALVEEGLLVRDISKDHEGGWMMRAARVVAVLKVFDTAVRVVRGET